MFEHLANCHGEWNILLALLSSIPFIGIWFRQKFKKSKDEEEEHESR